MLKRKNYLNIYSLLYAMSSCEMCGREGPTHRAIVEGSMMNVCTHCSKFGNVIEVRPQKVEPKAPVKVYSQPRKSPVRKEEAEPIILVVADYASRVRLAREKALLTQEELAKAVAEKESVIQKVENSQFEPPLKLAHKLEVFLKINILKEVKQDDLDNAKPDIKSSNLTIGDLIRFRKS